jgi:DNA-binding NarL/FixJ family response regulator
MRVLLADDQVWLRSAMRLLLEQEPNLEVVGEACDTHSLLHATKAVAPDLILLDWELPGLGTLGAHQRFIHSLHTEWPALKIIALSVNSDAKSASLAVGVAAFVNKAEPPEGLLAALRRIGQTIVHNQKQGHNPDNFGYQL